MRILLFHPTLLPPKDYGGVERVVLWLAKGLVERGHKVYVAALPGSQLPFGCELVQAEKKHYTIENYLSLLPKSLDVIHFMAPIPENDWEKLPLPSVLTVHGNGKPGEVFPKNTVFLSQDHAYRHKAKMFVYNGIDPTEFFYTPKQKKDWYLFLSKTSWRVKNVKGAIKYCKDAGVSLKIAGGSRPLLSRLECIVNPLLQWEGPVSGKEKAQLLTQAKALLFPVVWSEPFGLVIAEALMSGTPVIGNPRGSLPEMISVEVGALPRSEDEWIEILRGNSYPWDPEVCRQWAYEKFHYARMAENYEKVYQEVVLGRFLNEEKPIGEFVENV